MKVIPSNKSPVETISKNIQKHHDMTGSDCEKQFYINLKKSFSASFWAVIIVLSLLAIGGIIFELFIWLSFSSDLNANEKTIYAPNLEKGSSKQPKILNLETSNGENRPNQSNSEEQSSLASDVVSDGMTETAYRTRPHTFADLFTTLVTSYETSTEQFEGTVKSITSMDTIQEQTKSGSKIYIDYPALMHY